MTQRYSAAGLVAILALLCSAASAQSSVIDTFADRSSCEASIAPASFLSEDFEPSNAVADDTRQRFPSPLNSTTGNAVYNPGDIVSGLELVAGPSGNASALQAAGANSYTLGNTSVIAGGSLLTDETEVLFSGGTDVVCLDYYPVLSTTNTASPLGFNAEFYDAFDNLLGTETLAAGSQQRFFFGARSTGAPIARVRFNDPDDQSTNLDNVSFGDHEPPSVTLTATSPVTEGSSSTVTATLSRATTQDVTVALAYSGTATDPADYSGPSQIVVAAGATSADASLTTVDDTDDEGNETVVIDVSSVTNAVEDGVQRATVTITDNDAATITVSPTDVTVSETGTATFSVTLSETPTSDVTIAVSSGDTGEATVFPTTLTFTAGTQTLTEPVTVTGVGDGADDGDQVVPVELAAATSGDARFDGIDPDDVEVTVTDIDDPTVSLSSSPSTVSEDGGTSTITATLSSPTTGDVLVTVETTRGGGGADLGDDFTLSDDGLDSGIQILIPDGSLTGTITLTALNNDGPEGTETAIIAVDRVSGNAQDRACFGGMELRLEGAVAGGAKASRQSAQAAVLSDCATAVEILDAYVPPEGDNGQPDDAGNIVDSPAQVLPDESFDGDDASFFGFIGNGPETEPDYDVDCFAFEVVDAMAFSAYSEVGDDGLDFDTAFWLYTEDGILALEDDDDGGPPNYSGFDQGELSGAGYGPGTYRLCVSYYNNYPLDANGDYADVPGDGPIADWEDYDGDFGSYQVELTGVGPARSGTGTVSFAVVQQAVSEGVGTVDLVVVIDDVPDEDTDVTVALISGDPADVGGFTSETVTFSATTGSPTTLVVTVPVTDDGFVEDRETFLFALSVEEESGLTVGAPSQTALVVVDNDGPAVTVTIETDGGLVALAVPLNGLTAGDVAAAAGADAVYVLDGTELVEADPGTVFQAGDVVVVDAEGDIELTGSAGSAVTTYETTEVAGRVLVAVGNTSDTLVDLDALTVTGGTLADVVLVFDGESGAFVPVSIAGLGGDLGALALGPFDAVVFQVIPDGDAADVSVTLSSGAAASGATVVTDAPFTPTDGETAVVLALRPAGTDGATANATAAILADGPGDVVAIRFGIGTDDLDAFDGFDVVSPLGGTLAAVGPAGADAWQAALSLGTLVPGSPVTVPLAFAVPTPGEYELALTSLPDDVDGRPVVVEIFDGTAGTVVTAGAPFTFTATASDVEAGPLSGRFAVRVSLGAGVSTEGEGPTALALSVWPNPAAGRVSVSLDSASGDVRVTVMDALGREVVVLHDGPVSGEVRTAVEAGRLTPGAYLVRVETATGVLTRPFTVVR